MPDLLKIEIINKMLFKNNRDVRIVVKWKKISTKAYSILSKRAFTIRVYLDLT